MELASVSLSESYVQAAETVCTCPILLIMTLQDVSVKKFIKLYSIHQSDEFGTELDKEIALLCALYDKPEQHFLNMNLKQLRAARRVLYNCISLDNVIPKPERYIKANGNVYAPCYKFNSSVSGGQFVDVTRFAKDPKEIINNLPKILASICVPTKRTLFVRHKRKYMAVPHEEVSEDMEQASIYDAYSIALFFWAVWNGLLQVTGDYLVKTAIAKKTTTGTDLTKAEAAGLLNILETFGDGITARKTLQ